MIYYLGLILNTAAILMTAGLGASICIKSGEFNLGGEGQVYAGGFVAAGVLNLWGVREKGTGDFSVPEKSPVPFSSFFQNSLPPLLLAILSAAIIAGLLALISAFLKKYRKASFLLTSFIVSSAIIPIIDGLIAGPFRQKDGNLLATPFIAQQFRFKSFSKVCPGNFYIITAVIFCMAGGYFLFKTKFGRKICIYGQAPEYALYTGYSEKGISYISSILSGAFHGIAGAAAICGTYFTCHQGFYSGMGWNALAVAMVSKSNPYILIPVSLLMSLLLVTADNFALFYNFDFDISMMIQAVIIFLVAIPWRKKDAC